jgi:hypothetical protein
MSSVGGMTGGVIINGWSSLFAVRRMAAMSVIERLSGSVSEICWSGDASINLSITASVASRFPA